MPHLLLLIYVHTLTASHGMADHLIAEHRSDVPRGADRGQATTEYALVLLAAAMVALLVIAWASSGGGAARISQLFNRVIDAVISRV
jgi:hypothetical protein